MRKILVMAAALGIVAGCDNREPGDTKMALNANPPAATGTSGTSPAVAPDAAAPDAAAPGAAASVPETPAASAANTAPAFREVTIPAGTVLSVRLTTPVSSDKSRPEQRVDGTLTRDVRIGGAEALESGASLRGIVTNAERSGRVKGLANVAFKFDHISSGGTVYPISTRTISREAKPTKKRDAATIGIPAAGGAIIGGILGGKDGAVKGGAVGGAAGTAAVLSTRGQEVRLGAGTIVSVRLASPLTVRVR